MKKSSLKTVLPFIPLLVGYIIVILVFSSDAFFADESRHMVYATNLTEGYYTEAENPEIGNGPGYPLVIAPFVFFDAPLISIKLLNAVFLLIAVVYFFKTLSIYISTKYAIATSYLLGVYPALLKWMVYMHSEALAFLLVCGFLYHFMKTFASAKKRHKHIAFAALFLGFLVLTKVIFAYVILISAVLCSLLFLFKKIKKIKSTLLILGGAFVLCTPYLAYTYSITDKLFYWGTGGGQILYWRSTPFAQEYGDWVDSDIILKNAAHDYFDITEVSKNHKPFLQSLEAYSSVQKDSMYSRKAMENMKQYPIKYIQNTSASAFRLFFNAPFSYSPQKITTYFYIVPNMFLLVFLLASIYLAIRKLKLVPFEIRFIGLMGFIFIGGLTLLDGRVRHLIPIIPLLVFFMIFIFNELVELKINGKSNQTALGS